MQFMNYQLQFNKITHAKKLKNPYFHNIKQIERQKKFLKKAHIDRDHNSKLA